MRLALILCVLGLVVTSTVHAAESVQLKGLFGKKSALLAIDGKETVLKVGKSRDGVTLVSIDKRSVVVSIGGKQQVLDLSKQTASSYKKPTVRTVRIASGEGGHYWIRGQVNNHTVNFVVDTGATTIAMNLSTAKRLGLDYQSGTPVNLSTANGVSRAMLVNLNKVTIGEITQYNIEATVSLDDALPFVLLGNSFLGGVDWRRENGVLILESRL